MATLYFRRERFTVPKSFSDPALNEATSNRIEGKHKKKKIRRGSKSIQYVHRFLHSRRKGNAHAKVLPSTPSKHLCSISHPRRLKPYLHLRALPVGYISFPCRRELSLAFDESILRLYEMDGQGRALVRNTCAVAISAIRH